MIILFDNSLLFSIDCMDFMVQCKKKKLKHLIIFYYVKIFLLDKGRKATKRRTQRRTSTREEPRKGSPSGQPSMQPSMQPSTNRGGTSRFIVKFSFFFFFNFIFYSLKMVIFMVMIIIFYLLLFFFFQAKERMLLSMWMTIHLWV
jgi:cellulose synthase/poly-beta-1,6-N-acetylglucosamine synthase-like glycosyltransferase